MAEATKFFYVHYKALQGAQNATDLKVFYTLLVSAAQKAGLSLIRSTMFSLTAGHPALGLRPLRSEDCPHPSCSLLKLQTGPRQRGEMGQFQEQRVAYGVQELSPWLQKLGSALVCCPRHKLPGMRTDLFPKQVLMRALGRPFYIWHNQLL